MNQLNPKTMGLGVIFLILVAYAGYTVFAGSGTKTALNGQGAETAALAETVEGRVPTVITDPFFHPSVQEVAPNGAPAGAISGPGQSVQPGLPVPPMTGTLGGGNVPIQPALPHPNDPYGGAGPGAPTIQPLPGNLPAQMPSQSPGQTTVPPNGQAPEQGHSAVQAVVPVKVQVQGLVVSTKPAAFVRINDGSSLKIAVGEKLEGGILVTEISEQTVTFSRKGKKFTLRPGQAENL